MRGLDAVTFAGGEEVPLFEVVRVGGDVAHGSLSPARLRFHRVWIEEPHLWVRWDESGFELEQILAEIGTAASEESPLAAFHAGLVRWAGDGPVPTSVPPPMGARIVDGEVELRDGRTEPPFEVRLRKLQALLDGPAGTAGPLQLRMEAAGPARSRVRFSETSSTSGVSLTVGLDNVRFRHLDAYVHALTGYEAVAGRIDLEARARLRPVAQAEIEVEFEGIRLRGDGGADPSALLLGAPLPEIVERLEGETGQGVLQIGLQGDPERLSYGFLEALPDALLKAVDAALRGAPGTPSELASGTVSDPVPPGPVGGQTSEDPAPERP